jgi:16S rRNA A1518/A1519 N6-dimethyltransferase RsmA/KsgA/DIM1 with predicted DNA glycosylase/AP lyase activity
MHCPACTVVQSFLIDNHITANIVNILDMNGDDTAVETGSALGIVRAMIAKQARKVSARPKI